MSKGLFFVVIVVALSLILCGCNKQSTNLELPENPIKFVTYSYCPEDSDHGYRAFDYNGRTYIHFAEHNGAFKKDIGSNCLGLIVQEGVEYDDELVIQLKEFENNDILMIYFPYGLMDPPYFLRAIDTQGQVLKLPDYIDQDSIDDFWK
ncbi:MAG: hypothetical protein IKS21_06635 [Oscillospiraceae bacterium]|nr:hypothetical protein [Oscillospiraceae bacterium]